MQAQYGPTSVEKGDENRRPWVQNGAPQVKFRPPRVLESSGASWAPSRPQKGALGGKEEFENCVEGSWDHLGVLLARLGPILGRISPPRPRGGHFWTFLGRPSRDLKNELLFVVFFTYLESFFCAICCPLLSSLLRGWRRRAYAKN